MPNYLKMPKKSQVLALLELGWSYRRIEAETGVRRETVSRYDLTRRSNAAKTFPDSDASPPSQSPDLPPGGDPNAAKAFAGSERRPLGRRTVQGCPCSKANDASGSVATTCSKPHRRSLSPMRPGFRNHQP